MGLCVLGAMALNFCQNEGDKPFKTDALSCPQIREFAPHSMCTSFDSELALLI